MKLLSSASKIVFILVTLALIALTFLNKVDPKDFVAIAMMVFTYYFSNKGTSENNYLDK